MAIVNKFRCDTKLFDEAIPILEEGLKVPFLGIVPYFADADYLPAEDAVAINTTVNITKNNSGIRVAVPRLPRISNFDDLDPLRAETDVDLIIVRPGQALPADIDLVLLPGSKSTRADLYYLFSQGWHVDIKALVRRGASVMGLCGGYQMLGKTISDPYGVEGKPGVSDGLGLLDVSTILSKEKRLEAVTGEDINSGELVHGYEMHMGVTTGPDTERPVLKLAHGTEGASSINGKVLGSYVHGIFAADGFRHKFLNSILSRSRSSLVWQDKIDETLDHLADHLEGSLDLDYLLEISRIA